MFKKVTFVLSADIAANASNGLLLGEFNNWDKETGFTLKKAKDGSLKATVELEAGKTYQYRYLLEDGRWVNDSSAEQYAKVNGLDVENCVVTVEAPAPKKVAGTKIKAAPKTDPKAVKAEGPAADDLTRIEGIGKKIAELLEAEGISSYAGLSKSSGKKIKGILADAGAKYVLHDPTSWPKQAKLAAAGKWDELKALQKELKGGK
jgi:predicted flap endonuclease-1-like 5' DNA nuclease